MRHTTVSLRHLAGLLAIFSLIALVGCSRPTPTPTAGAGEEGLPGVEQTPAPPAGERGYPPPTVPQVTSPPREGEEGYPPPPTLTPTVAAYVAPQGEGEATEAAPAEGPPAEVTPTGEEATPEGEEATPAG